MANQFQILITAKDQASAVVGKVTSALGKVKAPIAGINSAVEGIADLGGVARTTAGNLGVLGGSMGAVASAGTIAGVATLVSYWGQVGVSTANAAGGIGIAAGRLRTLQGAAGLAGLSTDAMTGSLNALGATLQDAAYGRAPEAAAMLNMLGIRMSRTASGAVDAETAMGDLAEAISKQSNPQTQARIAQMFGVETLLPMLRKGRAGWNAYLADIKKYAEVSEDTQRKSEELGGSLNKLKAAVSGVGVTLESTYSDKFGGSIDKTAKWIGSNKELTGGIAEVGVAIVSVASAARYLNPTIAIVTAFAEGALLIYRHWDQIDSFFERKLTAVDKALNDSAIGKLLRNGKPDWLPDPFGFSYGLIGKGGLLWNWGDTGKPNQQPAGPKTATPPAAQPSTSEATPSTDLEKSLGRWRRLFGDGGAVGGAKAAVPPEGTPAVSQASAGAVPGGKAISLSNSDIEALTRVAIAEAGNQGRTGLEGVVRTVLNRAAHPAWGGTINDVVNARNQFEPVTKAGGDWRNLPSGSASKRAVVQNILGDIAAGRSPDPTGGATYFLNRDISGQRGTDFGNGRDGLKSAEIGDHTFYKPGVFGEKPTPVPNYAVLLSDIAKANQTGAGEQPASAATPSGTQQQPIQVEVRLTGNVPPGTTATVRGQDDVFRPTRVDYSTPDFSRP